MNVLDENVLSDQRSIAQPPQKAHGRSNAAISAVIAAVMQSIVHGSWSITALGIIAWPWLTVLRDR